MNKRYRKSQSLLERYMIAESNVKKNISPSDSIALINVTSKVLDEAQDISTIQEIEKKDESRDE